MALYYGSWQADAFKAVLSQIDASSRDLFRADFRYRFFKTVDAWNQGGPDALEHECAGFVSSVSPPGHPLLPGPYLVDYQPACFRVILDRARDAAIAAETVALFVDALSRMMVFVPITITAVCLAQLVWLPDDEHALARLCAALQSIGSVGEAHALLLRGFDALATELTDADPVLGLLERAWILREPLTTPYYVVMAAQLIHDAQLPAEDFVAQVRAHRQLAAMPIRARWVIEAAVLALGAQADADAPWPHRTTSAARWPIRCEARAAPPRSQR